jgi:Zn-dependent protease
MQASTLKQHKLSTRSDLPAALLALALKGKALLFSLLKLKVLFSLLTAVISVFAYSRGFGWAGATGFVVLIFVHEMGHVLVLRSQGVPASVPMFIPFLGAIITMKAYPKGVVDEAYSAIAGPVLGSVGALVCLVIYFATGLKIWAWLAYIGFFLNLFNLLPMSPLDGGRIVGAVWRGFWIFGVVAAVVIATWLDSPVLLLFSVFGLSEINRRMMRVHWSAYALLGVLAMISSAICGDLIWGVVVAFFAYTNGSRAQALNAALARAQIDVQTFRIKKGRTGSLYLSPSDPLWLSLQDSFGHPLRSDLRSKILSPPVRRMGSFIVPAAEGSSSKYFAVPVQQRLIIGSMYVGLATVLTGVLVWMHWAGLFERPQ